MITLIALVVLAEFSLRVWVYRFRDPAERYSFAAQTFELVPGEYPRSGGLLRVNPDGFAGPDLQPNPGFRIVALGDSCTIGEGDGRFSYPAMLRQRLSARAPGVEVVNAGLAGLDAEQLSRRLETAVLPLEPDIVLIFAGWNDLMKRRPLSQGKLVGIARLSRSLDDLWLSRGFRKFAAAHVRPLLGEVQTGDAGQTGRFRDFRPEAFEASLARMIAIARDGGADVFVLTLPTVLRREMVAYDLEGAGVIFPYFASGDRLGDTMDLIDAYNRSIREIGAARGAHLIDLAKRFDALESTRGYFLDTMHPSSLGMSLIAESIDRALLRTAALRGDE